MRLDDAGRVNAQLAPLHRSLWPKPPVVAPLGGVEALAIEVVRPPRTPQHGEDTRVYRPFTEIIG